MSQIADFIDDHFNRAEITNAWEAVNSIGDIDAALSNSARLVMGVRDLVVQSNGEIDVNGVATACDALLCYLGQTGRLLDQSTAYLSSCDRQARACSVRAPGKASADRMASNG